MSDPPSLQDILASRQRAEFTGREYELELFRTNLARKPNDAERYFILNVSGQGGIGKTSLIRQYQQIALDDGGITGFTNELENEIPGVMARLAKDIGSRRSQFRKFNEKYNLYRETLQRLEADPDMPQGAAAFAGRMLARTGTSVLRATVPDAAMILDFVGDEALADQVGAWAEFVQRRISNKDHLRLLLNPVGVLTGLFLAELAKITQKRPAVLFFDTYEYTEDTLDAWLRSVFAGEHGQLTTNTTVVIAGREGLNRDLWVSFESLIRRMPLDVFSDDEARRYLERKSITDESTVAAMVQTAAGLPLLLATISTQSPYVRHEIVDTTATAVSRFLKWIPDPTRREFVLDISLARRIDRDVVSAVVGDESAEEAFEWLIRMPFIRYQGSEFTFHPVARDHFMRLELRESLATWRSTHLALAQFYSTCEELALADKSPTFAAERWYHELCFAPREKFERVLSEFVRSLPTSPKFSEVLARVIDDAAWALSDAELRGWAEILKDGIAGYQTNDFARAIAMLNRVLGYANLDDDAVAIAYAWRGEAQHWSGHYVEALYDLSEAVRRAPRNDWVYVLRGITNRNLYAYDDARRDLAEAVALNDRSLYGLTENAKLRFQVFGDFADARVKLDRALELDDKYGWAYVVRGDLRRLTGDYVGAIADFTAAISTEMRYPHYYWALVRRADSCRRLGSNAEAMSNLELANNRYPLDDWIHYEMYLTRTLIGEPAEAESDLDVAIEIAQDRLAEDGEDYFQRMKMVVYEIVKLNSVPSDLAVAQLPTHHSFELYHDIEDVIFAFPTNLAAIRLRDALHPYLPR